jgi:hypothetical protein
VCRLAQHPASLQKLLQMLVGLGSADPDERQGFQELGWAGYRPDLTPFSDAMRHLQQHHTLEAGSLVAVHWGLRDVVYWTMEYSQLGPHTIHCWALGQPVRTMPLPLMQLLGVPVDLPCFLIEGTCGAPLQKVCAAVGSSAPALALALTQTEKWTKKVQQQRLGVVKGLVAAGASYKWEGPAGATVLSLAVELVQTDCLEVLLARPNPLREFTPEQVSAAVVAAARLNHDASGCMVLEAVAAASRSTSAATDEPQRVTQPQRGAMDEQSLASKQVQKHGPLAQQQQQVHPVLPLSHTTGGAAAALQATPAAAAPPGATAAAEAAFGSTHAAAAAVQGTSSVASASEVSPAAAAVAPAAAPVPAAASASGGKAVTGLAARKTPEPAQSAAAAPAMVLTPAAVAAAAKMLASSIKPDRLDVLRRLLAAGVDPNVRPDSKSAPLLHQLMAQADAKGSDMVSQQC